MIDPNRQVKQRTRKVDCHPAMKDVKTATDQSCLTPEVVKRIAKTYNHKHPDKKVDEHTQNPAQLWQQLHQRLQNKCKTERCWLKELPEGERQQVDRKSFTPEQPKEWKMDPDAWLSNTDIEKVLRQYEEKTPIFKFLGPAAIDFDNYIGPAHHQTCVQNSLCRFQLAHYLKKGVKKIGIVFNTDPHTKGGSHWISLFIDLQDKFMMFFDSTGDAMPPEVKRFMTRVQRQALKSGMRLQSFNNYKVEHQEGDTECGMYSLFFIITMLMGTTEFHPQQMNAQQKLNLFLKEFKIPDGYVQKYRDVFFDGGE